VTLPELLWQLVEIIPDGCMLRLGMTNPPYILEHLEEMAKIFHKPCVYAFLHIPVQSGSDQVLSDMKREYFVADFERVVDFLRDRVPGITIATDVICGFPTETEEDFQGTLDLVRKYQFPSLFINQFYPRPHTPAARLPRIPTQVVKQRTKRISEVFQSIHPYESRAEERYRILVTEVAHDQKHYVGHNKFYEQVLVPKKEGFLGKMMEVEITSVGKFYMMGKLLKDGVTFTPSISAPLSKGAVSGTLPVKELKEATTNTTSTQNVEMEVSLDKNMFYWKAITLVVLLSIVLRFIVKYWSWIAL